MKHLFYLLALIALLWELLGLTNPKRVHQFIVRMKAVKDPKFETYNSSQKSLSVLMLCYMMWTFIGLFSFQWPVFLFFIILSLIPKSNIIYRWLDFLVSFCIVLFIILNAYHFNINLWAWMNIF